MTIRLFAEGCIQSGIRFFTLLSWKGFSYISYICLERLCVTSTFFLHSGYPSMGGRRQFLIISSKNRHLEWFFIHRFSTDCRFRPAAFLLLLACVSLWTGTSATCCSSLSLSEFISSLIFVLFSSSFMCICSRGSGEAGTDRGQVSHPAGTLIDYSRFPG